MRARAFIAIAALAALAACSERPQDATGIKTDKTAFSGTGLPYQAPGWTPGDKTSWEQQLRTRGQGQNEYVKVN